MSNTISKDILIPVVDDPLGRALSVNALKCAIIKSATESYIKATVYYKKIYETVAKKRGEFQCGEIIENAQLLENAMKHISKMGSYAVALKLSSNHVEFFDLISKPLQQKLANVQVTKQTVIPRTENK